MKNPFVACIALAASAILPLRGATCTCETTSQTNAAATTGQEKPEGHPLRGVIVAVMPEKSALLVRHEEIPGVMRAMTMLLKVDAPTLAAAKKDEAINATLVKKADGWWLEDVRPATATGSP